MPHHVRWLAGLGAVAMGVLGAAPSAATASTTFGSLTTFSGGAPYEIAVGDFNRDGRTDFASADLNQDIVRVFMGDGTGYGFPSATGLSVPGARSLGVGDFNRDGRQDLAVASFTTNKVYIFRGNGDGTFTALPTTATGAVDGPVSVAVADFNSDGIQDLAVVNYGAATVSVMKGIGNGTFAAPSTPAVGSLPTNAVAGDFNGDAKEDLAVAGATSLRVLMGNGDGSFTAAPNPPAGGGPEWVDAADLDRNGKLDLAVANFGSNNVSLLLGNGDGTFTASQVVPVTQPTEVSVGDLNGDGVADLAVGRSGPAGVSVFLRPSFSLATTVPTGGPPFDVALADLNGDGSLDMVTVAGTADAVRVLLNVPHTVQSPSTLAFGSAASPVPQGTTSAPQTVTVSNDASAPWLMSGVLIGGANPGDFFVSNDSCRRPLIGALTCTLEVRFAPGAQGARSATLFAQGGSGNTVSLSGVAGPLPQGPAGSNGAQGPKGDPGPQGAPGRDALVTCKVKKDNKTKKIKVTCAVVLVRAAASGRVQWRLTRGARIVARGIAVARGRRVTLSVDRLARLRRGRYVLRIAGRRTGTSIVIH